MRLKIIPTKNDKKLYLVKTIKKPGAKFTTTKTVEFFGNLSELEKIYSDPISHFKEVAKNRTEEKENNRVITPINVDINSHLDFSKEGDSKGRFGQYIYMGQYPLLYFYKFLELDKFVLRKRKSWGIRNGMEIIYKLLVLGRVICPGSKLSTFEELKHFKLGTAKVTDDDVYNALEFIGKSQYAAIKHINEVIDRKIGRDTSLMYYDVTNYYMEVDKPDNEIDGGLRVEGVNKENRPLPIIQMGLFMDSNGLPVSYDLFPGNNTDVTTFIPMIDKASKEYGVKNVIYVADKGMMSQNNIVNILTKGCGYIISDSPRKKQSPDLLKYVLDEEGYTYEANGTFKYKSRIVPIKRSGITYKGKEDKKTCTVEYNEIQIVFWSEKYAERTKKQREESLDKAAKEHKIFDNYNGKGFFHKVAFDPLSEEYREDLEYETFLDVEKLKQAEQLDGYYILRTNVIGKDDTERPWQGESRFRRDYLFQLNRKVNEKTIINMYRGLWEIEETFKITKSFLSTRPLYVRKENSIKAHFLTCFIALLIVRLIERNINYTLNHSQVIEALREAIVAEIDDEQHLYRNIISSKHLEIIGKSVGKDLTKDWYTDNELKALCGK